MEMKFKFDNVCKACGRTRNKSDIRFDPHTLFPYCANMTECNDQHPNSYSAVAERGGEVIELVNFKDAGELHYRRIQNSSNPTIRKVAKMMEVPTTFRVGDVELAMYLVKLQESREYKTMKTTIVEIIKEHKEKFGDPDASKQEEKPAEDDNEPEITIVRQQSNKPAPVFKPVATPTQPEPEEKEDDDDLTF